MSKPDPNLEALIMLWRSQKQGDSLIASIKNGVPSTLEPSEHPILSVRPTGGAPRTSFEPTLSQALFDLWPGIVPRLATALDPYMALLATLASLMSARATDASVGHRTGPHFDLVFKWGAQWQIAPHEVGCDITVSGLHRPYASPIGCTSSIGGWTAIISATATTTSSALWLAINQVKLRLAEGLLLEKTGFSLQWGETGVPRVRIAEPANR